MDESDAAALAAVGPRLRARRRARGASLARLAAATGVSASTLSRLETGRLVPTLAQLLPLARVHGVPLEELVGAPATGDPRIHPRPERRGGLVFLPLAGRPGGLQAYKITHPPARGDQTPDPRRHPGGDEWLYVLHGRVRVIAGALDLRLGAGESVQFDTREPHWVGNLDPDEPAETLALFGRHGEATHVSAAAVRGPSATPPRSSAGRSPSPR